MYRFAIEGINGSGKTPTIELVRSGLEAEGLTTQVHAPFHRVREIGQISDVFPLWESDPSRAIHLLHTTLEVIEDDIARDNPDVVIFDRHWPTVFTQAIAQPELVELWGDHFLPQFLFTSPHQHAHRLAERGYNLAWLESEALAHYIDTYDHIYSQHPQLQLGRFVVSSAEQDLQPIADTIITHVTKEVSV